MSASSGVLVVNADDLGVSRGATLGIIEAHQRGIVTSASLAVTTPGYDHALESCIRTCPDLGIGLHFTLSSGKPVSPTRHVPMLVDEKGFFRWRFLPLLRACRSRSSSSSRGRPSDLLEQVRIELEAQLERIHQDGVRPDHIDGERHVHLIPEIFEIVAAAARHHGVPYVRAGRELGWGVFTLGHSPGLVLRGGFAKSWLLSRLTERNRRHLGEDLKSPDHVASYLYSGRLDLVLRSVLARAPVAGVVEIMVHPGIPEESAGIILGNRDVERYLTSEDRRRELQACIAARAWTGAWKLRTFAQLAREDPAVYPSVPAPLDPREGALDAGAATLRPGASAFALGAAGEPCNAKPDEAPAGGRSGEGQGPGPRPDPRERPS